MASSLGPDGRFWPCNEDLHWCWFSPHGVSRVYLVSMLMLLMTILFLGHHYIVLLIIILTTGIRAQVSLSLCEGIKLLVKDL